MGYITTLFVAPATAIQQIADSSSVRFPSSGDALEYLGDMALVRLQALIDGITGWDEEFDAVAIEFESGPYAESKSGDGGWSQVIPDRFTQAFAALSDADIQRILPAWCEPDNHAGEHLSASAASTMIQTVRDLCSRALTDGSSVIFSTRE